MKFYRLFLLFSRGKQIAVTVCAIHLLTLFGLLGHHLFTRRTRPVRPILVRTVLPVPAPHPNVQVGKREEGVPKPKPKPAAPPKKEIAVKPKPPIETVKPKSTVAPKKGEPVLANSSLLKEIGESLETLNEKSKQRPVLNVPKKIESNRQLTEIDSPIDPNYGEFLVAFLQNTLDLPEYGEVKAKIEIDRFGKLVHCEILQTKSIKNGEFIKNQLPELLFPCLNDFGILANTQTFTITFRNVEMH